MRTPNIYTDVNTDTQRTALPANHQRILLVTHDAKGPSFPSDVYDAAQVKTLTGVDNTILSRMIVAASQTCPLIDAQGVVAAAAPTPDPLP